MVPPTSSPDGLGGARVKHASRILVSKHVEGTRIYTANKAMFKAGEVLLFSAQAAEQIRVDIRLVDVIRLVYGTVLVNEHASDPNGVNRMFALVIAGIRTQPSWVNDCGSPSGFQ